MIMQSWTEPKRYLAKCTLVVKGFPQTLDEKLELRRQYHPGPHDERGVPLLVVELVVMQGRSKGVPELVAQKVAALCPIAGVLTI